MGRATPESGTRLTAWIKAHDAKWSPDMGPIEIHLAICHNSDPTDSLFTVEYSPWDPKLAPENIERQSAESLAKMILEAADEHAGERQEIMRFAAMSSLADKNFIFTAKPDSATEIDPDGFREEATDRGLLFQLMRHNEANLKAALATMEVQLEQYRRLVEAQRGEINMLYEDRRSGIKVYEELLSERHVRDMQVRQMENDEKRMAHAADMLKPLVGLIGTRLMGNGQAAKALLNSKEHPPLEMARALFTTLDENQVKAILSAMHPSQQAATLELMTLFYKEHEEKLKEEADTKDKANGSGASGAGGTNGSGASPLGVEPMPINVEARAVTAEAPPS